MCSGERQFTVTPVPSANPAGSAAISETASTVAAGNGNSDQQQQVVHPARQRSRPLTGESGASSSSATPSLKSMEQSSQDSAEASSEDDTGSEVVDFYKVGGLPVSGHGGSENSPSLKQPHPQHQKHLKIRSTNNRANVNNSTTSSRPTVMPTVATAVSTSQPQSTWI